MTLLFYLPELDSGSQRSVNSQILSQARNDTVILSP